MSEVKYYHVSDTGLAEGASIGRITVVLAADFDNATRLFLDAAERCIAAERREAELREELADAKAEIAALSKNVIDMTHEDFDATLNNLRRMGASIDGDNAYKRDLCDSIVGSLAFGAQDRCPPPEGHWAQRFWDMGRESSANTEELVSALELVTDCLSKALTGGEVSAARAGNALVSAAELLAKQTR
ncbi:hypothetical protein PS870_00930 [Pseudomonas fluorescens]|uniref:Uncharacterized protein n=1 Tax=Pseudomonas fluorescens TaxID=294 RepID=A0A5E7HIU6_PSEFL|nr:hypothetical protein [Pseudomonas fluorescens]VVO63915.1 hypothetical protein PS870_00930 [Pseudomonas fluorescens]